MMHAHRIIRRHTRKPADSIIVIRGCWNERITINKQLYDLFTQLRIVSALSMEIVCANVVCGYKQTKIQYKKKIECYANSERCD